MYKNAENCTENTNTVLKETDQKITETYKILQELQTYYIEKLTAYKSLIGF